MIGEGRRFAERDHANERGRERNPPSLEPSHARRKRHGSEQAETMRILSKFVGFRSGWPA
jgi:hypothetical protein